MNLNEDIKLKFLKLRLLSLSFYSLSWVKVKYIWHDLVQLVLVPKNKKQGKDTAQRERYHLVGEAGKGMEDLKCPIQ